MLVDSVLEPGILSALAAFGLKWRGKLFLLNKLGDVLAGVGNSLRFEVAITDKPSHRHALS